MYYEVSWFAQNALYLALFIETLKQSGGHWVRDNLPLFTPYYALAVKLIALVAAVIICVVAKADALLTLEIYGFRPEVGYIVGGVLMFGGNTLIDAAWDKRKTIAALIDAFKPSLIADEDMPVSMAMTADNRAVWERYIDEQITIAIARKGNF